MKYRTTDGVAMGHIDNRRQARSYGKIDGRIILYTHTHIYMYLSTGLSITFYRKMVVEVERVEILTFTL